MAVIPERTGKLRREEDKLAALAEFSNQLCEIVASDASNDERSTLLKGLLARHKNLIQIESDDLTALLQTTQQSFEQRYSSLLGAATKTCRFAQTVATLSGQQPQEQLPNPVQPLADAEAPPQQLALPEPTPAIRRIAAHGGQISAKGKTKPQIARLNLAKQLDSEKPDESEAVPEDTGALGVTVAQCLAEFGRSGSSEHLTVTLLQALQQYLEVPRILAFRATLNRRELAIVGGVGDDIDGLAKELRLPLSAVRAATDPFSLAYHSNRDFRIDDVFSAKVVSSLPERYYEAVGSSSLAILACNGKGAQPLLLLLDLEPPRQLPSSERLAQLGLARSALAKILPTVNH